MSQDTALYYPGLQFYPVSNTEICSNLHLKRPSKLISAVYIYDDKRLLIICRKTYDSNKWRRFLGSTKSNALNRSTKSAKIFSFLTSLLKIERDYVNWLSYCGFFVEIHAETFIINLFWKITYIFLKKAERMAIGSIIILFYLNGGKILATFGKLRSTALS